MVIMFINATQNNIIYITYLIIIEIIVANMN